MKTMCISWFVAITCVAALAQTASFAQDGESKKPPQPQVVGKILKVDFVDEEINPPNLLVTATGQVPTGGYTKVRLERAVYVTPPEDGIQDYFLIALPPSKPATQVVSTVKATNRWKGYMQEAPWIKGIRIHGIGDDVIVKMFSGAK